MFTYLFWRLALERAVKTFAQTLVALFSVSGIGLLDAPWITALSAAGMAAMLSVLTSMASAPWGTRNSPCLVQSAPAAEQSAPAAEQSAPAAEQAAPAAEQAELKVSASL